MERDNRTLRIEIPPCAVARLAGDPEEWTDLSGLNGWQLVPIAPVGLFWQGTIDLGGWVAEKLTFFPRAGFIQEGPWWIVGDDGSGQTAVTIISTIPLNPDEVLLQIADNGGPAMLGIGIANDQQNYETLMFCETQVNLLNSTNPALGICTPLTNKQTGSLEPTAADTLYVMKLIFPFTAVPAAIPPEPAGPSTIGTGLLIPASRVVVTGSFVKEDDTVYLMRLKRSLELNQSA